MSDNKSKLHSFECSNDRYSPLHFRRLFPKLEVRARTSKIDDCFEGPEGSSVMHLSPLFSGEERGTLQISVIRRSPVRFRPKTCQLKSIWIWANRPSSKGSKLLFSVIKANKRSCIAWNNNSVPLIESLCGSNPCRHDFSVLGRIEPAT